jgi:hypothetical protein
MNVLIIWPGHGSEWLIDAVFVDRFGKLNSRGRFVHGKSWEYDGGWNMPDDYRGQYMPVTVPRRWILKIEID